MALTLPTGTRNAACNAIVELVDVGTGTSYLKITNAGATELVKCAFPNPAFGNALVGVATANTIVDGTVTVADTAALAAIIDRDAADVITGLTVGTSGSNINLSSVALSVGDKVSISSMTVTVPAS
jgi:hypothetical protein